MTSTAPKARRGLTRLTATMVATLPPGDHTDPATQGLQLRVRPSPRAGGVASRTWLFRYTWRGEWVRLTMGHHPQMSLADARDRALQMRRNLDDGIDPRTSQPARVVKVRQAPATGIGRRRVLPRAQLPDALAPDDRHSVDYLVSEFVSRYLRAYRRRPEQAEEMLARDVLPNWSGRDARSIKPLDVIKVLDAIVARGSPTMANRVASLLRLLFLFGVQRHIIESTPVQLLMPPGGRESSRSRTLTDDELRAYLADSHGCAGGRFSHVVTLLLLTGQRRGEISRAKWREVSFEARTWRIPIDNSKTERAALVPLSAWALREFEQLKRYARGSPWVLPAKKREGHIHKDHLTCLLKIRRERFTARGIAHFTLHDLRRTCRTGLGKLKVPRDIAELILNHAPPGIVGVYDVGDHLEEKREALDRWAERLEQLKAMGAPKQ